MCTRLIASRAVRAVWFALLGIVAADTVAAQSQQAPVPPQHEHPQPAPTGQDAAREPQHDTSAIGGSSMAREASGTAWLPDTSPMYAVHRESGAWNLMAHGNFFIQFLDDAGERGNDQFGSINWVMGMAQRTAGRGRLGVRGMISLEPWTIRGCGYPDLLASGELCEGEAIHDRQHQHDLFMDLSVEYDRPLFRSARWQIYGGPVAEPALGPAAYPHRVSAMPNLLAPIAHHWLDSTHITFGAVTTGVYGRRWKAEASLFNGREPDDARTDFDLAALDSYSGRLWLMPNDKVALQVSGGHLKEAEAADTGGPRVDVERVTASATYHRSLGQGSIWATTVAWGRNAEGDAATNAVLFETNVTISERDTWFGRVEGVGKSAHDLDVPTDGTFTVGKLQGGYTRYLATWSGLKPGLGVTASAGLVPAALRPAYGSRAIFGFAVFVTLRPAAMSMMNMLHPSGAGMPEKPAAPAPMDHSKMKT